jgi:hemerythrin-like domain-containing protein
MKRDKNLQELSRDHHHGLLLGWKIRQGLKLQVDPELIVQYIRYFFHSALLPHFGEEETHILTYLEDDNTYKERTLNDHRAITSLVEALADKENEAAVFLKIAELLDDHIRFEERELFPYLQEQFSSEQLNEIGVAIDSSHKPFDDTFHPQFWNPRLN